MQLSENCAEELVASEGEQSDRYHEHDRENRCRNPFLTRRPRHALELQHDTANEGLRTLMLHLAVRYRRSATRGHGFTGRSAIRLMYQLSSPGCSGRADRTRTCNRRFWRPLLYQLSYRPRFGRHAVRRRTLFGFSMGLVTAAEPAILAQLHSIRRLLLIFLRVIITAFALGTRHHNHNAGFFLCHFLPIHQS